MSRAFKLRWAPAGLHPLQGGVQDVLWVQAPVFSVSFDKPSDDDKQEDQHIDAGEDFIYQGGLFDSKHEQTCKVNRQTERRNQTRRLSFRAVFSLQFIISSFKQMCSKTATVTEKNTDVTADVRMSQLIKVEKAAEFEMFLSGELSCFMWMLTCLPIFLLISQVFIFSASVLESVFFLALNKHLQKKMEGKQ